MIARTWRCLVSSENAPDYVEHFENSVFPELNHLDGFREASILRRPFEDILELTVITFWDSMEAIRGFAGDNTEMAVVAPEAQAVLRSFDATVTHYEVILNVERHAR